MRIAALRVSQRYGRYLSSFVFSLAVLLLSSCSAGSSAPGGGAPATPDFSVSISPSSLTVVQGSTTTFQLTVQPLNGFSGAVTLTISNLPGGVTVAPASPITISPATPQTITVTCASTVSVGSYRPLLTATSGSLNHSIGATLAVVVPTFTLSVNPSPLSLVAGQQGSFQVSLQPEYGFTGTAQVQISGLQNGITMTPASSFSLTAGSPQTLNIATSTTLGSSSYPLTVTGTSGTITTSATETLSVQNQSPPPSRSDFVRTDDTPGGAAYDQLHKRVFVSNPVAGTVDVVSSTTYQILHRIPVPSPQGVDISPDDSTVFVGTGSSIGGSRTQAVFAIDTATMAVIARYLGDPNTSTAVWYPTPPLNPIATPDGNVEFWDNGNIVKWSPSTGTITTVLNNSPVNISDSSPFSDTPYLIAAHSGDHSKVIISNDDEPGTVWLYDTSQNVFSATTTFSGYPYSVAANPNGTQFAVATSYYTQNIYILDANLNIIATIPGGGNLLYSADGSTLYVTGTIGSVPVVSLINASTLQWEGTAPSFAIDMANQEPPTDYTYPMAVDETGRIFGSILNGMTIDDATDLRTYTGTESFPDTVIMAAPNDGPVGEQQTVAIETDHFVLPPAVWFGALPAQNVATGGYLTATSPAITQVGPVNIRIDDSDGVQSWLPQAYTYGAMLSPGPDIAASNAGGTSVDLYGYGLGYFAPIGGTPTGGATSVNFGNSSGTVTSTSVIDGFSLWDVKVATPSVPVGEYDLTAGYGGSSSTLSSAYHAVAINSYTLDGTPYSMAYDARRDKVYVAVTDHVDVFSLATNAFVSTIQIPTLNNVKQLGGMAMTPDGNWLIVANWGDGSVAVINPDSPTSAQAVAVGTPPNYSAGITVGPFQIAATDNGQAYISLSAAPQLLKNYSRIGTASAKDKTSVAPRPMDGPSTEAYTWLLNLQTMTITPVNGEYIPGSGSFMAASPDGSFICSTGTNNGPTTLWDVATGTPVAGPISDNQGAAVCAVNGGVVVSATQNRNGVPLVSDMSMRIISSAGMTATQYSDLLGSDEDLLQGIAADNTGALMYVPWGQEIALFDSHTGEYRERIVLPALLEQMTTGSLLIDQTGKQIFVVSQSGFTVIQLDSLPLAIGSLTTSGSTWSISGTGFVSGTTVAVDGVAQSVSYTDAQHLTISGAPAFAGIHTLTLTNPDGHTYTYGAGYLR